MNYIKAIFVIVSCAIPSLFPMIDDNTCMQCQHAVTTTHCLPTATIFACTTACKNTICLSCLAHILSSAELTCPLCHAPVSDAGKRFLIAHTPTFPTPLQTKNALHRYLCRYAPIPPCGVSPTLMCAIYHQLNAHPTELILPSQRLTDPMLDAIICALTPTQRDKIRLINLANNQLRIVPPSLAMLENTRYLFLNTNPLESIDPVCQLTDLQQLTLDDSHLQQLPAHFGQLRELTWLVLSDNPLHDLPDSFGNLVNLRMLDVTGTRILANPHAQEIINRMRNLIITDKY